MPSAMKMTSTRYWMTYTRNSTLYPSSLVFELLIKPLLDRHSALGGLLGEDPVEHDEHNNRSDRICQRFPADGLAQLHPGRCVRKRLFEHLMQAYEQYRVHRRRNRDH